MVRYPLVDRDQCGQDVSRTGLEGAAILAADCGNNHEGPDGTTVESVDADNITDPVTVQGLEIKLEDGYSHLPSTRLYWSG